MSTWHNTCKNAGMNRSWIGLTVAVLGAWCAAGAPALADEPMAGLPDPTRPSFAQGDGAEGNAAGQHGLVLQSVLIGPQRRLAVINGRTLAVGERIGDGTLTAIWPHEVVVKRASGEFTLRLVPRYVSRSTSATPKPEN
jgi:MSHA biogenesis protein MshK